MTKDEALDLALEALLWANIEINNWRDDAHGYAPEDQPQIMEAITAIKQAIAAPVQEQVLGFDVVLDESLPPNTMNFVQSAPVQEPVEFFDWYDNAHWGNEDFKEGCHRSWNAAIKYTTPLAAQRQWVDLTGDEIVNMLPDDDTPMSLGEAFFKFAELVEAKLKEKNT
jgi:hypothetical protein